MAVTLDFSPEVEKRLRERAAQAGLTVEGFVRDLVEREVLGANGSEAARRGKTFDEIFGPLRKEVEASGITDEELDRLLEGAREEAWQEKKARRDGSR